MPASGFKSYDLDDVRVFHDGQNREAAESVLMASGQTSSLTPNHRHPPGTVLIKKTSDGKFYLANDLTNCDSPTAASVNTLITNPGSGGWNGTLTISGHWGTLSVTLSGDNTDAAVATAINAAAAALDPEWGPIVAADATGSVSITNRDVGHGTYLHAVHTTVATVFGANGAGDNGTDPVVVVTTDFAELKDANAVAQDYFVTACRRGNFVTANLTPLTPEARGILEKQGSKFFPLGS